MVRSTGFYAAGKKSLNPNVYAGTRGERARKVVIKSFTFVATSCPSSSARNETVLTFTDSQVCSHRLRRITNRGVANNLSVKEIKK